jgi:hypothetical protein
MTDADADTTVGERSWVEMNAIRGVVTELHALTRIVATSADDVRSSAHSCGFQSKRVENSPSMFFQTFVVDERSD